MEESTVYDNPESRARFEAYSRLQATAVAFGESVPIPEIVAIGGMMLVLLARVAELVLFRPYRLSACVGQSDGKSSLLEAFLGFRFNIREVSDASGVPQSKGGNVSQAIKRTPTPTPGRTLECRWRWGRGARSSFRWCMIRQPRSPGCGCRTSTEMAMAQS